jgi:hypothetical protein
MYKIVNGEKVSVSPEEFLAAMPAELKEEVGSSPFYFFGENREPLVFRLNRVMLALCGGVGSFLVVTLLMR